MKIKAIASILFLLIITVSSIFSEQFEDILLQDIANNISKYKNKTITLKLKLKFVDNIFEKIIFYDKKNHDIEFDFSQKVKEKKFKMEMLNLHNGMDYYVTFIVSDTGNLGRIIGDLQNFKPIILLKIPVSK